MTTLPTNWEFLGMNSYMTNSLDYLGAVLISRSRYVHIIIVKACIDSARQTDPCTHDLAINTLWGSLLL